MNTRERLLIECDAQQIVLAVVKRRGSGLRLTDCRLVPIAPVSGSAAEWAQEAGGAIQAAVRAWTFRGAATLVLPPHLTWLKRIESPPAGRAARSRIVRLSVEQHLPFALHDVTWAAVAAGEQPGRSDCLAAAVRNDVLEPICRQIESGGIRLDEVLPRVAALRAAIQAVLPVADGSGGLLVEFGVRSIAVVLAEGNRWAVRVCPTGWTGGRPGAEQRAENERVAREVRRTTGLLRQSLAAADPVRVCLAGAGADELREAIATELPGAVAVFAAPDVWAGAGSGEGSDAFRRPAIVGAALAWRRRAGERLNLLPDWLAARRMRERRRPWRWAAAALFAAALLPPILHYRVAERAARTEAARLSRELAPLRRAAEARLAAQRDMAAMENELRRLEAWAERKTWWLRLLAGLQEGLAESGAGWLETLQVQPSRKGEPLRLTVTGRMRDAGGNEARRLAGVRRVREAFAALPEVGTVEGERVDLGQAGAVAFQFVLVAAGGPLTFGGGPDGE
ncbi:MAG: hypothetical protein JNG83_00120 [Opitutaceae bacterium]|nr:hypothetical protein [Opitutaceae bacterium]